ncbi:hypothetical protein QM414_10460 [Streptococcus mitis]|uniref:hypothetical protein n=1 Tax=Streptococcus mitis TaxID=28037 RepID=UPI001D1788CD|nr:hypothetical protein [Streptococcus mitis]MDU1468080.1 hypothetical protein [Streptococcus mitis]
MYFLNEKDKIRQAIEEYEGQQNTSIHNLFHNKKEQLIEEFNQYSLSLKTQIQDRIVNHGVVSSQELPDLLDQNKWTELKECIDNLIIWLIYIKGNQLLMLGIVQSFQNKMREEKQNYNYY